MTKSGPTTTSIKMTNENANRKDGIAVKRVSWLLDEPTNDRENNQDDEMMTSSNNHGADQFEILAFVQSGNGSKIYDVIQKQRNHKYTMEVVPRKNSAQNEGEGEGDTSNAKNTRLHKHSKLKAPSCYLTQLKYSFQTKTRKYFVLSHLHNERNLKALLNKQEVISEQASAYIIAQIIAGIDCLHQSNVPYGTLNFGHVYFDNKGRVLLKRTYNRQNCWTPNECYGCHRNKCKNQYHTGSGELSNAEKANDFNNVGQLLVHLVTGSQHSYSMLESLHQRTKDFAYLLLRHDVDLRKLKTHQFLVNYPLSKVLDNELEIPDEIVKFLRDTRDRQLSLSKTSTSSSVDQQNDRETKMTTPPSEILVGVRKTRSKSEEASRYNGKSLTTRGKQPKERSKSYNSSESNKHEILHHLKSFSKSRSESRNSVFGDTANENEDKSHTPTKSRRTSIDMYQKRLQEISKVLDKNRDVANLSSPTTKQGNDPIQLSSPTTNHMIHEIEPQQQDQSQEPTNTSEFFFEKMYSENEALRTILTKYGLLKERKHNNTKGEDRNEDEDGDDGSPGKKMMSRLHVPLSPENNLLSSKRKQRRTSSSNSNNGSGAKKNNIMSRSCNNIQILFENTDNNRVRNINQMTNSGGDGMDSLESTSLLKSSMGKKQKSESCLNKMTTEKDSHHESSPRTTSPSNKNDGGDTSGSTRLIDRLNGLNKSKTFYMKRSLSLSSPCSPSQIKRHFSDSIIKPSSMNWNHSNGGGISPNPSFSVSSPKHFSALQSLSKLLKSGTEMNRRQSSHDSGLNLDHLENEDETTSSLSSKRRQIERNDSGLGSFQERDVIRVWKPGKPDSLFLDHEEERIRATTSHCYDCDSEIVEQFTAAATGSTTMNDQLCKSCGKSRVERREAVVELIETEINFGEDLKILKEEFYTPLKVNHICTTDDISKLFLNLQELVDVNAKLCASLQHGLETCIESDDFDYMNLAIGDVFLNNMEFFEAYEWYCVKQKESVELLKSLTKKSDLLRVFLQVSSRENVKLRKMDLKSFLTMPVQRIMKYPLLLSRIYKHTPKKNVDHKPLKQAIAKVEEQISNINALSKNLSTPTARVKKLAIMDIDPTKPGDLTKMVASLKEWKLEETTIIAHEDFEVIETDLVNLTSWSKDSFKKISYQQAVIGVRNAPEHYREHLQQRLHNEKTPYTLGEVKDAVIVFFKQKTIDKCQVHKTPIQLKDCIVAINLDIKIAFEVTELEKVPLTFVARNASTSKEWRKTLNFVIDSLNLKWRQRRSGRPNIMTDRLHHED